MIGITGGIASGKSTVAKLLRQKGYPVIDADVIVSQLVLQNEVKQKLISVFGENTYLGSGEYHREFVRNTILPNSQEKLKLESILHPLVIAQSNSISQDFKSKFGNSFLFYEASLIFEAQRESDFDDIILVCASRETKVTRLSSRNGFVRTQAENLIDSQMPDELKIALASFVMHNQESIADLDLKLLTVLQNLRDKIIAPR